MSNRDRLVDILAETVGEDVAKVEKMIEDNPDITLATFQLDSLDTVNLIMEIEEEFDIQIDDNDAEKLRTFSDLEKLVEVR